VTGDTVTDAISKGKERKNAENLKVFLLKSAKILKRAYFIYAENLNIHQSILQINGICFFLKTIFGRMDWWILLKRSDYGRMMPKRSDFGRIGRKWSDGHQQTNHRSPSFPINPSSFISTSNLPTIRNCCSSVLLEGNTSLRYLYINSRRAPSLPEFCKNCITICFNLSFSSPFNFVYSGTCLVCLAMLSDKCDRGQDHEPLTLNVFVKPDDQNHACMSFGMARKRA